jgi:hypothetical protein
VSARQCVIEHGAVVVFCLGLEKEISACVDEQVDARIPAGLHSAGDTGGMIGGCIKTVFADDAIFQIDAHRTSCDHTSGIGCDLIGGAAIS